MKGGEKRCYEVVIGVDLASGSPSSRTKQPHYAAVLLRGDKLEVLGFDIPLRKLIRIVWEVRPQALALDNVFELGSSERDVVAVLNMMPEDMHVVQVTRMDGSFVDIREAAALAELKVDFSKPSPIRTAIMAALLAARGYGQRVKLYEDKTKILVVRKSKTRKGGMSQARYARKARAAILQVTRSIKKALDTHGLDYDLVFRKSRGGLESSMFIVYASREKLYGVVRQGDYGDVRVIVRPIYKPHIFFEDQPVAKERKKYLIVGVDPGMVVGIAALDLDGNVVFTASSRSMDRSDIIQLILSYGEPLVIATDVNPAPEAVKKLAAALNAELYVPPQSLSVEEKQAIASKVSRKHGLQVENAHVRDAIAAAFKAYHAFSSKLRQVESAASKIGLEISVESVKAAVLRGKTIAEALEEEIEKVLSQTMEEAKEEEEKGKAPQPSVQEGRQEYEKTIARLSREKALLARKVRELEERVEELERELWLREIEWSKEVAVERRVSLLQGEVKQLREELLKTRERAAKLEETIRELELKIYEVLRGDKIPAPYLKMLTKDSLSKIRKIFGSLSSRVLYVENHGAYEQEALEELVREEVKGVVLRCTDSPLAYALREYRIPAVRIEGVEKLCEHVALLPPDVESRIEEERERMLREEEEACFTEEDLLKIIAEYRSERAAVRKRLQNRRL